MLRNALDLDFAYNKTVFLTLFFNQTKSEMLSALKMINYIVMHPL